VLSGCQLAVRIRFIVFSEIGGFHAMTALIPRRPPREWALGAEDALGHEDPVRAECAGKAGCYIEVFGRWE
jgi:hypothetical protein